MAKKFQFDWGKIKDKMNEQQNTQSNYEVDERFYVPKKNDRGCFQGLIRFLPPFDTDVPYVKYFYHNFKVGKKIFFANCPTSIGKPCPVCEANSELWETGIKENKDLVSKRKRNATYISNIYVIKDPITPENNGKVFLYKYGWTIYDKIMKKISPPADALNPTPLMIFDYYEGANFILDIGVKKTEDDKYPTYEGSQFEGKSELGDENLIERVHSSRFKLMPFIAEDQFDSYEKISLRLEKVLGSHSFSENEGGDSSKPDIREKLEKGSSNMEKNEGFIKEKETEQINLNIEESEDDFFNKLRN